MSELRTAPDQARLCMAAFHAVVSRGTVVIGLVLTAAWLPLPTWAQAVSVPAGLAKARPEQGARWAELKPAQRSALIPLERDWAAIDAPQKQKWIELSARFPAMTQGEQGRIQARMAEWAKLTPTQRGQARMQFQEAKKVPAPDRQARWDAYQALPIEQKQQLAAKANVTAAPEAPAKSTAATTRHPKSGRELGQAKSNVVPNPAFAAAPVPITPTVVQARPGVTTTPISKRPSPPSHQQAGLPKIAATPEFVDQETLLPKRGPQGAATRPGHNSPPAAPAPSASALQR